MNEITASPLPTSDHRRIKKVSSFEELISTPFQGEINALCWERSPPGDFAEVVRALGVEKGITTINEEHLLTLTLSKEGCIARDILLKDQLLLRSHDLLPVLDCINGYFHDLEDGPVPTHVQSYHTDSATVKADTYLCTYHGLSSEGICNHESIRRVEIPETRAELLKLYGGEDDQGFLNYLNENFFDLHYVPLPGARPYTFGVGNLWRIAIEYPGSPVPPCIHRAPATPSGSSPRLLLIS